MHQRSKEIDCGIFGGRLGGPGLELLVELVGRLVKAGRFEVQKRAVAFGGVIDEADVGGVVEPARTWTLAGARSFYRHGDRVGHEGLDAGEDFAAEVEGRRLR